MMIAIVMAVFNVLKLYTMAIILVITLLMTLTLSILLLVQIMLLVIDNGGDDGNGDIGSDDENCKWR